jgi:uncharacterized membrane protein
MSEEVTFALKIGSTAISLIIVFIAGFVVQAGVTISYYQYSSKTNPEKVQDLMFSDYTWGTEWFARQRELFMDLIFFDIPVSEDAEVEKARKKFLKYRQYWHIYALK